PRETGRGLACGEVAPWPVWSELKVTPLCRPGSSPGACWRAGPKPGGSCHTLRRQRNSQTSSGWAKSTHTPEMIRFGTPGKTEGAQAETIRSIRAQLGARSIVLVGMPGSGKSAVGRRLAARLGLPFLDADEEIERAAGKPITDIFKDHGEPYFREGERKVIARLLRSGPQVLATGGGAFMVPETRDCIRQTGISVWLKAELALLLRRVLRRN